MIKILIIATNIALYAGGQLATGLWLSELTHLYSEAKSKGYEVVIASPNGGNIPIDPESLKPMLIDDISKHYLADSSFRAELQNSVSLASVAGQQFDLVYLSGGHGTMYDFPNNATLQHIISEHYERGAKVGAICHGVGGLLNVKLSDGSHLISNKRITGFSWFEESLARRKREVPFNLEEELKKRNPQYSKAFIPMTSKVVVDGNLITGQNPFSSKQMSRVLIQELEAVANHKP